MSGQVSVNSAVEVLLDRGPRYSPRWTVGSGFLIGGTRVLTAAHNVGEGKLSVRVRRGTEYTATFTQVGDVDQGLDLAIVNITDPSFRDAPDAMVQFAKLNRDSPYLLQGCWAIGFPRFKEKDLAPSGRSRLRDTAQINGEIPLAANLISDMLELRVTATPQASPSLGSSEWEGMSGAVVFCKDPVHGDRAIGVIVEHYQPEGTSSLTVVPITAINKLDEPTARKWWNLLGVVDHQGLPHLPPEPHIELVSAEGIYRQQVINKYKSLDFSGFASSDLSLENVPMEEVFVRLTLTVEKKVIQEPGQGESRQRERVITVQEPVELGQALSNHLLIVGEPGAGKSTLLRWLAVTFAQGYQREPNRLGPSADADRLPVLVELGNLPDRYVKPEGRETPNWIQFLPEYLPTQIAFTNTPPQLLARALADGRCLLLFDGLDEVADRQVRARMARSLADLARLFPGNRVIIGSRPAGVSESEGALHPLFRRCQIQRFTPEDVQRFFRFWYALGSELTAEQQRGKADALYTRVQAIPAILQLATTPLLSTILVLIWRKQGDLPERRVDLYERCCRELIEQWEASHDVTYQGVLGGMDWADHLHLLTFLAYTIHSQEQRTSATREELVRELTVALQAEGRYKDQSAAVRAAKQFLDTLGLRSGLLQYIGDNRYGFPHLTFQEYLAARYIAARPDPEYIDLMMAHLHEAWWQEVHLLTIAHLGSESAGASRASTLILTILRVYRPPSWFLRSSGNARLRLIGLGKLVPQAQLERRIAWILAREFELAAKGYMECMLDGTAAKVETALAAQVTSLVEHILYDKDRYEKQSALLTVAYQLSQKLSERQGNEAVVSALLTLFHNEEAAVRRRAANNLLPTKVAYDVADGRWKDVGLFSFSPQGYNEATGRWEVGRERLERPMDGVLKEAGEWWQAERSLVLDVGNERMMSALLKALHTQSWKWEHAAKSLGQVGVGNERVVNALLEALHDKETMVRERAVESLGRVGVGNERVVNALLEVLHDEEGKVRVQAVEGLGRVGVGDERVVSALLEALHDEEWATRWHAVGSLGRVGVGNERVVNALLEALKGGWVQVAASLGRVGVGDERVVSALLEALHDEKDMLRRWDVVEGLGRVGVGDERVVSALLEALHDEEWATRWRVVEGLGRVGVGNERVVNALLEALHDKETMVREHAVESLGRVGVGNERVVNALLEVLHDPSSVKFGGVNRSRLLETTPGGAFLCFVASRKHHANPGFGPDLIEEGDEEGDEEGKVRVQAVEGLGRVGVGNERVVSALLEVLHDVWHKGWDTAEQAAKSLGQMEFKDPLQLRQVLVALNRCLHSIDDQVRTAALVSIRQLLDGQPIPGYRWLPLRKRRLRHLRIKRVAFWLSMTTLLVLIGLAATWLLGILNPNGFPLRFLAVLAGIIAFVAAIVQVLGRTLRDPWDHA